MVADQSHHFFDTRDRALDRARIGVRLRETGARLRLTVKSDPVHAADPGAPRDAMVTRRVELEATISRDAFERALADGLDLTPWVASWRAGPSARDPDVARVLDTLGGVGRLETFGAFRNERTTGQLDLGSADREVRVEVELDRTRFPGDRLDHELEIELDARTDEAEARAIREAVLDRLAEMGIRATAAPSKLERFRDALDRGDR